MRFLTAVALALVMLWVPVDGVAQQPDGLALSPIGDWLVAEMDDPFDDTDRGGIMVLIGLVDSIAMFNITCRDGAAIRIGVSHPTVRPDRDGRVSFTYRLGSSPAQTVLHKPSPSTMGDDVWRTSTQNFTGESLTRMRQELVALSLSEDPRVAVRIESPVDGLMYQESWSNLKGTQEALLQFISYCF